MNITMADDDSGKGISKRDKITYSIYGICALAASAFLLWSVIVNYQQMIPCVVTNLNQNLTEYQCWYIRIPTGPSCDAGSCYTSDPSTMANCTTLSLTLKWQNCVKDLSYIFTGKNGNIAQYNIYNNGIQCFYRLNYCDDPFAIVDNSSFIGWLVFLIVWVIACVGLAIWICRWLNK